MKKYLTVFTVSWQNEFVYRLNFVLWRFRNVLRLLMTYFLWRGIFIYNSNVFGYTGAEMLSYVFLVLVVQAIVLSAPSADNIGGEIGSGDLSNYLVKPVNYLRFWFTRDMASKFLNLIFSLVEISLLWLLLRPVLFIPGNLFSIAGFMTGCISAVIIYFLLESTNRFIAFWTPENTWGLSFLVIILIEILGGGMFPLDILPGPARVALDLTPFPYLVYYPVAIILGKVTGWNLIRILTQSVIWCFLFFAINKYVWHQGLKVYAATGK